MSAKRFRIRSDTSIRDVLKHKADTLGDKVFLTYIRDFDKGIDEKYTYRDMHLQSNRVANGLANLGADASTGIS